MAASPTLLRLSDTGLTIADPAQDVRGLHVVDSAEQDVGRVEDLLIDDAEKKVRFLLVGSGGFLGLGEKQVLIPVDAITKITNDRVHINRARDHVASGPAYDPKLEDERLHAHYSDVYG